MKTLKFWLWGLFWAFIMSAQVLAGTWTANEFVYKPSLGARGAEEKARFDSGTDRLDARLGKEIWVGDPKYGSTLPAAIAAIAGSQAVLRVPAGTHNITADLTIPANITLKPERGAILSNANATTKNLTINGELVAGLYQVFNWTGTGKITFGPAAVKEVYPEWWGAKADGATDCLIPMQQCFDAAYKLSPARIFLSGSYLVSDTLTLGHTGDYASVVLTGASPGTFWDNSAGFPPASELRASVELVNKPLLTVYSHRCILEKFNLRGAGSLVYNSFGPGANGTIGLRIANRSEYTVLRDVSIQLFETGMFIGDGGGTQGGCAETHLYSVGINHCSYCIQSDNSQACSLNLHSCSFGTETKYGFKSIDSGAYSGNALQIFGGDFGCTDILFEFGQQGYGNAYIAGAYFENGLAADVPTLIKMTYSGSRNVFVCTFTGNDFNYAAWTNTVKPFIDITGNFIGLVSLTNNTIKVCNPIVVCGSGSAGPRGLTNDHFSFKDNHWYWAPDLTNAKNVEIKGDTYIFNNRKKAGGQDIYAGFQTVYHSRTSNSGTARGSGIQKFWGYQSVDYPPDFGYWDRGSIIFANPDGTGHKMGWMVTTTGHA